MRIVRGTVETALNAEVNFRPGIPHQPGASIRNPLGGNFGDPIMRIIVSLFEASHISDWAIPPRGRAVYAPTSAGERRGLQVLSGLAHLTRSLQQYPWPPSSLPERRVISAAVTSDRHHSTRARILETLFRSHEP